MLPERWDVSFEAAVNNEGSPAKRGSRGRKDAAGVRRGWQGRESRAEAGVHCSEQGRAAGEALDLHKWRLGDSAVLALPPRKPP